MGRRKKNLPLDEKLEMTIAEINNMENSLKELKALKKELEEQIRQERLSELDAVISEKGLSIQEVKELLSN